MCHLISIVLDKSDPEEEKKNNESDIPLSWKGTVKIIIAFVIVTVIVIVMKTKHFKVDPEVVLFLNSFDGAWNSN